MAIETVTIQLTISEDLYHRIEAESGRAVDDVIVDLILPDMPILDPPLSETIVRMRDEERY